MPSVSQTTFESTLADFFRERLQAGAEDLDPRPQEETLWYLGSLLARFGDSGQVFSFDEGELSIRPLALLYRDAVEVDSHYHRCLILRQLGDLALFMGALFPENYSRRGIGRDYFIGMGGGAYDYLGENARHNRRVFSELADRFARLLELVAAVCGRGREMDATDILQLFQRWRESGDPQLAAQLRSLGVVLPEIGGLH
ncbi:hypothetical protein [Microbulbifer hydrolyticus]|uniref:Uncharacterized protein n=1 Tax=Microbulbifer hydrolyticus TaxID=48074 RepID=A0A6P1T6B0_9GAMM|nr:hypothetical protein [Microbulbifer hydrolyticus]MBB5211704.1 hypothetical protein [Microbulbifer hydrolyticus]QHQ37567.1 hypothetical protein GTQ55_00295 [Microbulbifer hydrolyticus]